MIATHKSTSEAKAQAFVLSMYHRAKVTNNNALLKNCQSALKKYWPELYKHLLDEDIRLAEPFLICERQS